MTLLKTLHGTACQIDPHFVFHNVFDAVTDVLKKMGEGRIGRKGLELVTSLI